MGILFAATITCAHLNAIINRINLKLNLTNQQKVELVRELKTYFNECTITIKK